MPVYYHIVIARLGKWYNDFGKKENDKNKIE